MALALVSIRTAPRISPRSTTLRMRSVRIPAPIGEGIAGILGLDSALAGMDMARAGTDTATFGVNPGVAQSLSLRPTESFSARAVVRRQQAEASAGTIRREFQVLNRLLSFAVKYDKLDKNRLQEVELPEAAKRPHVAEPDDLEARHNVKGEAVSELWLIILVAVNTGLREEKILAINRTWIRKKEDGYWLALPPPATRLKGNPTEIPLNRTAVSAQG